MSAGPSRNCAVSDRLTAQLLLGPADILESDENGIIPEQDRVI
ncbi:phage tail fiber C-terminal domain-containing protein, partial [Escherichia coli]|nr:phage tail fiber C-terminal domain-containing protein [Escherichia coli]